MLTTLGIYRTTDGSFVRSVSCEPALADAQCLDGEIAVQQERSFSEIQYTYIDLATKQVVEMPPKPDGWYDFDHQSKQWVQDTAFAAEEVRRQRAILLSQTDWTDTASAPARLGQTLYDQWQTYRQALRDIPSQPGFPMAVVWPNSPSE